jgi:hypothetical protein
MTPEHRATKRRIQGFIREWKALVPPGVEVVHIFVEDVNQDEPKTLADTVSQWQYHNAKIRWYLSAAASCEDSYLEGTVVHELVHVLVAPIEETIPAKLTNLSEHTVEAIAKAFLKIRAGR